jgi:putative sigma-54 modulation protein
MDVTIQGHNVKVSDALETYARKKLDRLDRYLPNISEVWVDLTHQNTKRGEQVNIAQITIRHRRGAILRAEEKVSGDMQSAINLAVDNMYRRIQRFKGRHSRKGNERFSATAEEMQAAEAIPDVEEYAEGLENGGQQVLRRKEVLVAAMNEEEAIEQMELLGHTFFLFFNDATNSVNVVYKRANGGYGVLVPQMG